MDSRARLIPKAFRNEPYRENQLTQSKRREREYNVMSNERHRDRRDHSADRDQNRSRRVHAEPNANRYSTT